MRVRACLLLCLLACGERAPQPEPARAWPVDGFLRLLPADTAVIVRLPPAAELARNRERIAAFARLFGRDAAEFGGELDGLDRTTAPGLAVRPDGSWLHYLPAADKASLNRALGAQPGVRIREQGRWIVRWKGGEGPGTFEDAPLPEGDLAVRVRRHPLLSAVAQPGDVFDAGLRLGGGGFDFDGHLRPAPNGPTAELLAGARPAAGGLIDFIAASLGLRVETSLPPTLFATWLTNRIAAACTLREDARDRGILERILREALTGVDRDTGLAFGLEFRRGEVSFVALGRLAPGPPSPILAKLRARPRSVFGALVLDARRAPGLIGFRTWIAQGEPRIDDLPEAVWPAVAGLCGGEERGFPLAYAEHDGWWVCGGGPRGDLLARDALRRLAVGSRRSPGTLALAAARERVEGGDYVLGAVVTPTGLPGLPEEDRKSLRALLGAGPESSAPAAVALAGVRQGDLLRIAGRVLYTYP